MDQSESHDARDPEQMECPERRDESRAQGSGAPGREGEQGAQRLQRERRGGERGEQPGKLQEPTAEAGRNPLHSKRALERDEIQPGRLAELEPHREQVDQRDLNQQSGTPMASR